MNPTPLCLHCEREPRANSLRLCQHCAFTRGLRNLYKKRQGWSPAWDAHLQGLVERASQRLPLFPEGESRELPPRPRPVTPGNRNRRQRRPNSQPSAFPGVTL